VYAILKTGAAVLERNSLDFGLCECGWLMQTRVGAGV
jgi:hypothetical protein